MSRARQASLTLLLAVSLIAGGWHFWENRPQSEPAPESQVQACDSCSARHQNLTRLQDARNLTPAPDK